MTTEREVLVVDNIALAHYMANKYTNVQVEFEEIVSSAYVGLVKAALTFDFTKGYAFATYAGRVISNEILMFIRGERRRNKIQTISMESKILPEEDITLEDTICDKRNCYEELESLLDMQTKLQQLNEQDRKLVNIKLSDPDISQGELAEVFGHSQPYISRRLKNIKGKIVEIA